MLAAHTDATQHVAFRLNISSYRADKTEEEWIGEELSEERLRHIFVLTENSDEWLLEATADKFGWFQKISVPRVEKILEISHVFPSRHVTQCAAPASIKEVHLEQLSWVFSALSQTVERRDRSFL